MREGVLFMDIESIHIRPQPDGAIGIAAPQRADHAGLAQSPVYLNPPGLQ